jgi:uncharacterized membrane protein (DUF373 family)
MAEEAASSAYRASTVDHPDQQTQPANDSDEVQPSSDGLSVWFLEQIDAIPYWIVGTVFWIAALLSLAYSLTAFIVQVFNQAGGTGGFTIKGLIDQGLGAQDIITLVSDLLLTLIIMEVFGTVVHYLRERETTLKPFLFIGIISATRGILAVGARLSIGSIPQDEFVKAMVELGVNGAVIIALGVTMKLIGNFLDQGATPKITRRTIAYSSKSGWALLARRVTVTVLLILILLVILGLVVVLFNAAHT